MTLVAACTVAPSAGEETGGTSVAFDATTWVTGELTSDSALLVAAALLAVTWTRRVALSEAVVIVRVEVVAPAISMQLAPAASQRCHW